MQYHDSGQQLKSEIYFLQNYHSQNLQPSKTLRCAGTFITIVVILKNRWHGL